MKYLEDIDFVNEWQKEATTGHLLMVKETKVEAVRFANVLRRLGYKCKVESDLWYFFVEIERKDA